MALPCRNSREPVSNVSLKYAVQANVHAHVKTSYQTQQAAIHDTNRPPCKYMLKQNLAELPTPFTAAIVTS